MQEITTALVASVRNTIQASKLNGQSWPTNAEYAIRYVTSSWCNAEREEIRFFTTLDELKTFYLCEKLWGQMEDNFFCAMDMYRWDWGPELALDLMQERHTWPITDEVRRRNWYRW